MTRQTQNTIIGGVAALVVTIALFAVVQRLGAGGADTAATQLPPDAPTVADTAAGADHSVATLPTAEEPALSIEIEGDGVEASTTTSTTVVATTAATTTTTVATTAAPATMTTEATSSTEPSTSSTDSTAVPEETTSTGEATTTTVASSDTTVTAPATEPTATSVAPAPPSGALTAVEREIARLTNELRTNPTGPLRRIKPTTESTCGQFHNVRVENGTHAPVRALQLDVSVSIRLARDWSFQMSQVGRMTHRSNGSAQSIYSALGIRAWATGENVAWASGYSESSIAQIFFEGWRESDGHYCSMVSPTFSHFGVGHVRAGNGTDWGTQNFFSLG